MVLQGIGGHSSDAVLVVIGTEDTSDKSTVSETVVERIIIGLRLILTGKGITNEIVSTGNLATLSETSTKRSSCIIDTRVYDCNLDSSSTVSGSVNSIDLDLRVGGETSERKSSRCGGGSSGRRTGLNAR